jgi:hypothetical protein
MIYAKFLSFKGEDLVLVVSVSDYYLDTLRGLRLFPNMKAHPDDPPQERGVDFPVPWVELLRGDEASLESVKNILTQANPDYAGYMEFYSLAWDFDFLEPTGYATHQDFLNAVQLASNYIMDSIYEPYIRRAVRQPHGMLDLDYQVDDGNGEGLTWGTASIKLFPG